MKRWSKDNISFKNDTEYTFGHEDSFVVFWNDLVF